MFLVVPSLKILLNQGFTPWSLEDIYNTHNPFCSLQGDSFSSQVVLNYRQWKSAAQVLPQHDWGCDACYHIPETRHVSFIEPASSLQNKFCYVFPAWQFFLGHMKTQLSSGWTPRSSDVRPKIPPTNHFCSSLCFLCQVVQIRLFYLCFPLGCPWNRLQLTQGVGDVKAHLWASKPPTQPDPCEFVEPGLSFLLSHLSVAQYK